MELFLPSVIVILLAAFFAFLVVPRLGPSLLMGVSILALIMAGFHHYYTFSSEYRLSTWQVGLASYAPWIVMVLAIFFIIGALQWVFAAPGTATPLDQVTTAVTSSINAMPSASSATNPLTAALNTGTNSVLNFAKKNNSPMIPGLGFSGSQI